MNQEVKNLERLLVMMNEAGDEVIRHLQDTEQDSSAIIDKVDGVNSQWNELHLKLLDLKLLLQGKEVGLYCK